MIDIKFRILFPCGEGGKQGGYRGTTALEIFFYLNLVKGIQVFNLSFFLMNTLYILFIMVIFHNLSKYTENKNAEKIILLKQENQLNNKDRWLPLGCQ